MVRAILPHREDAGALDHATELLDSLETLATGGEQLGRTGPIDRRDVATWDVIETNRADLDVDFEGSVTLVADRQRLQQRLENLFGNAVEHGGSGVTIRIGSLDSGGFYGEDDCPGIPEGIDGDVFGRGYSGTSRGTGFGLAICERIAVAHGWSIEVNNDADGGARFEVSSVEVIDGSRG